MKRGTKFEVEKEVFERARNNSNNKEGNYFYMAQEDQIALFSEAVRCGYGLYNCMVHEKDGKYFCTYDIGDSCD